MKLKSVRFKENVRLPNGSLASFASLESTTQRISYLELVDGFVVLHRQHLSTIVPLSNVSHCETMEEPAIDMFSTGQPKGYSHEQEEGIPPDGKPAKKAKKGRKKAAVL
jgi:hypothetical protein